MVIINKDREISILVFAFFVFAFLVFLFMKPQITGMVVKDTLYLPNGNVNQDIIGNVSFKFLAGDNIPCNETAVVTTFLKSSDGTIINSDIKGLESLLNDVSKNCGTNLQFSDVSHNSPDYSWEGQQGKAFSPGTSDVLVVLPLNVGPISTAGTYTFYFYLNYSTDNLIFDSKTFTVSALSSDVKRPGITNVVFVNKNGSRNFMKTQYVNCSAFVKDEDSTSVSVSYIIWGNSSKVGITNPGATGPMVCVDSDAAGVTIPWSTGRTCSAEDKVSTSDLGYWNCTVIAYDTANNYNYSNATIPLLMVNSPPKLKKAIENLTWNKNENNTELDLDDYFDDPDEQSINYSVSTTSHINITISSTADVTLMPQLDWLGNENVTFKARDQMGAETQSNSVMLIVTTLLNCTSNWTCGNWSNCAGGIQTRVCTDLKSCSVPIGRPLTLQNCSGLTITCADDGYCKPGCPGGDPDCSCTDQGGYICGASLNCSSRLFSYDSGVCCSVPCSSSTNTVGQSGTSGFLGSQTDRILIGVGTIAAVVFIITLIIIFSTYMDKRKAVIREEKPAPALEQTPQQKLLDVTPVKIKPTNIEKMKDYIEQSLATKVPMRIIKTELNKVGWTESDIDNELNIARLRNYIQIKLNQGIPRAQIEQSLRMKGWSQFQIDEASRNTKVRPLI